MVVATALVWLVHAGLAASLTFPIVYKTWAIAKWRWWELLVLVVPFLSFLVFAEFHSRGGMFNFVVEVVALALVIPVAALLRVNLAHRMPVSMLSLLLICLVCLVGVVLVLVIPPLPD